MVVVASFETVMLKRRCSLAFSLGLSNHDKQLPSAVVKNIRSWCSCHDYGILELFVCDHFTAHKSNDCRRVQHRYIHLLKCLDLRCRIAYVLSSSLSRTNHCYIAFVSYVHCPIGSGRLFCLSRDIREILGDVSMTCLETRVYETIKPLIDSTLAIQEQQSS